MSHIGDANNLPKNLSLEPFAKALQEELQELFEGGVLVSFMPQHPFDKVA